MNTFQLLVDEDRIRETFKDHAIGHQSKRVDDYLACCAECAKIVQSLRRKTIADGTKITDNTKRDDPNGYYFACMESYLLRLANAMNDAIGAYLLMSLGIRDVKAQLEIGNKLASRDMGINTDSVIDTTGLSDEEIAVANISSYVDMLTRLSRMYNAGIEAKTSSGEINKLLCSLKRMLVEANELFAP